MMMRDEMSTTEHYHHEKHAVSWGILWGSYVLATLSCAIPVFFHRKSGSPAEEGAETSSGDATRNLFYRLLFIALLSRTVMIPVGVWVDTLYWQFVADTLPEITFASAWVLLVSFFVQLVGTAAGTGTATFSKPSIGLQLIFYATYLALVLLYFWNDEASVLLFALLCCIYAALFATLLYYGPRLVSLLRPSLTSRSGLAFRLVASLSICVVTFGGRMVGLARTVVLPYDAKPRWWLSYGCVELFPAVALLIMMYPNRSETKEQESTGSGRQRGAHIRRTSSGSAARRLAEQLPLIKTSAAGAAGGMPVYGAPPPSGGI